MDNSRTMRLRPSPAFSRDFGVSMGSPLSNMLEHGETLRLFCRNPVCPRVVEPDVEDLARRFGPDYDVLDIGRRALCTACGHRGMEVQAVPDVRHPETGRMPGGG